MIVTFAALVACLFLPAACSKECPARSVHLCHLLTRKPEKEPCNLLGTTSTNFPASTSENL